MRRCLWTSGPRGAELLCDEPRATGLPFCAEHAVRGTVGGRREAGLRMQEVGLDLWPAEERDEVGQASGMQQTTPACAEPAPRRRRKPAPALANRGSVDAANARAVALRPVVLAILADGIVTYNGIARALIERRVHTARGGKWDGTQVLRLFSRLKFTLPASQGTPPAVVLRAAPEPPSRLAA